MYCFVQACFSALSIQVDIFLSGNASTFQNIGNRRRIIVARISHPPSNIVKVCTHYLTLLAGKQRIVAVILFVESTSHPIPKLLRYHLTSVHQIPTIPSDTSHPTGRYMEETLHHFNTNAIWPPHQTLNWYVHGRAGSVRNDL